MRVLTLFLFLVPCFCSAQFQHSIEGDVKDLSGFKKIYLLIDWAKADSSEINDGRFRFQVANKYAKRAALATYDTLKTESGHPPPISKYREFYLSNPQIHVKGNELSTVRIEDDELNSTFTKYWLATDSIRSEAQNKISMYSRRGTNDTLSNADAVARDEVLHNLKKELKVFDLGFLETSPPSKLTIDLIEQHIDQFNVLTLNKIFAKIPNRMFDPEQKDRIATKIEDFKKLAIGSIAPDFTLKDTAGVENSLTSFRGKFVLLEFWASWCIPCRQENPKYREISEKFKGKNFKIVAISFNKEDERQSWLKAIHEDQIAEWTHLSDLKGYGSPFYKQYQIRGLPQNYLLDQNGVVIAQNIQGEALESLLKQLLQ